MMTCWIGVAGDMANVGATLVRAHNALVARHSDPKSRFELMNFLQKKGSRCAWPRRDDADRERCAPVAVNIGRHDCTLMSEGAQICETASSDEKYSGGCFASCDHPESEARIYVAAVWIALKRSACEKPAGLHRRVLVVQFPRT
jgi:hypothetical protein